MAQNRQTAPQAHTKLVTDPSRASRVRTGLGWNSNSSSSSSTTSSTSNSDKRHGKFSGVSLDSILLGAPSIPSGRREQRGSHSSWDRFPLQDTSPVSHQQQQSYRRRRAAGDDSSASAAGRRKGNTLLPSRTSKISQKLVLIPEDGELDGRKDSKASSTGQGGQEDEDNDALYEGSTTTTTTRRRTHREYARLTAYNVADGFDLKNMGRFLRETHEVSTRLYDDCLYLPYVLPLLPGKAGYRVKSNQSRKYSANETLIDKLIDTSEQRDHHFEYYSGGTIDDNVVDIHEPGGSHNRDNSKDNSNTSNNNSISDDVNRDMDSFNPSEPQLFDDYADNGRDKQAPQGSTSQSSDEDANASNNGMNNNASSNNYHDTFKRYAEVFIFHYGVVVFWNFTEEQERDLLGDLAFADDDHTLMLKPLDQDDIEIEEFRFEHASDVERPRIYNDTITLRSGDHIIKLTLSYAIAQSSKLSRFESRISPILAAVTRLPRRLAMHGTLGMRREQLLKKSGRLFKLRVDVNLSSSILDTPDFFWSVEPSLHPLYVAMREYLEIDRRVQVVNDRCKVFLEFFDICVNSVAERNIARVTWWLVLVILVGVFFSLVEILVRYIIIHSHQ